MNKADNIILLGGSAGSIPVIVKLLQTLPFSFSYTIIIVIHRLKNVASDMHKILSISSNTVEVIEPDDKEPVLEGKVYLAPQNYHLLIEEDKTFSLDYSELVFYSRPSIDVLFQSAAYVYKNNVRAFILSGANQDGAEGLATVIENGGKAFVQDPLTAEFAMMPQAAINANKSVTLLTPDQMVLFLREQSTINKVS